MAQVMTLTPWLDRCQAHVLEALSRALDAPSPPAVHAYAAIVWNCMPLLVARLDTAQRLALCEVRLWRSCNHDDPPVPCQRALIECIEVPPTPC